MLKSMELFPKEKIVSVNVNYTGFSKNIYSKENLRHSCN